MNGTAEELRRRARAGAQWHEPEAHWLKIELSGSLLARPEAHCHELDAHWLQPDAHWLETDAQWHSPDTA